MKLALSLGACLAVLGVLAVLGAARPAAPVPASVPPATASGGLPDGLFHARFVLDHAAEAGLDEKQVAAVEAHAAAVDDAERADLPMRIQIADELSALVSAPDVDEDAAARLIDEALDLERASRRRGLLLLVRVKNELDAKQVKRLTAIRESLVFETGGGR